MDNIGTSKLIVEEIKSKFNDLSNIVIASADMGGASYARHIANKIGVPLLITDKNRDSTTGDTKAMNVYNEGDVTGKETVIFVDDLIATFGSLKKGAEAVKERFPNFTNFIAVATHADFGSETALNISQSLFSEVWVTDSVPIRQNFGFSSEFASQKEELEQKIKIISISKILAQAIDNLHNGESVSGLWVD
jgi:ribose-phosphate pyrophosphokinase